MLFVFPFLFMSSPASDFFRTEITKETEKRFCGKTAFPDQLHSQYLKCCSITIYSTAIIFILQKNVICLCFK